MNIKDLAEGSYTINDGLNGSATLNINDLPQDSYRTIAFQEEEKPGLLKTIGSALISGEKGMGETLATAGAAGEGWASGALRYLGDKFTAIPGLIMGQSRKPVTAAREDIKAAETSQLGLDEMNVKLGEAIISGKKSGKDTSRLENIYQENTGRVFNLSDITGGVIDKTAKQIYGEAGQVALDIATAGTLSKGVTSFKIFSAAEKAAVAKKTMSGVSLAAAIADNIEGTYKATTALKLADVARRSAPTIAKGAAIGYGYDVSVGLQEGESFKEALKPGVGTVVGAIIPGGFAAKEATNILKKGQASTVINSLVKPLLKDFSYGKNPGRAVAEEGIVANSLEGLEEKISTRRATIGQEIGETISRISSRVRISLKEAFGSIDTAMEQAAVNNNTTLLQRLQKVKEALVNNLKLGVDNLGNPFIVNTGPKTLDNLNLEEAFKIKKDIGDLTQWTGNPSDDKTVNAALKRVYGAVKETMNDAVGMVDKETAKRLRTLNEKYADLTSAEIATKYREKINARQNLLSLGNRLATATGLVTGVLTNGISIETALMGVAGAVLDKALGSVAFKTRFAKWLAGTTPSVFEKIINANPKVRDAIYKAFDADITEDTKNLLNKAGNWLRTHTGLTIEDVSGGKATADLLSEAKKYKTAEEFVSKTIPELDKGEHYHVTLTKNIDKIKLEGLSATAKKNVPISKEGVYLFSNKDEALKFASQMEWTSKKPVSIIKVKNSNVVQDTNNMATGNWKLSQKSIKPSDITDIYNLDEATWKNNILGNPNRDNPLTKSQLTDIWNQANKADTPFLPPKSSLGEKILQTGEQKPTIKLKRDVTVTTLQGEKVTIPEDEVLKAYESGGKALLKDGREYVVSKSQYENIKNNSLKSEAKDFAPELKGTEETVKGKKDVADLEKQWEKKATEVNTAIKKYGATDKRTQILRQDRDILKDKIDAATDIGTTKFSSYQLPGGKNYKEVLIKAPIENKKIFEEMDNLGTSATDQAKWDELSKQQPQLFKSSHWDEPNVISHLRLNERTYKGKKVTFMEELQSDWAREARKGGEIIKELPENYKVSEDGFYTPAIKDENGRIIAKGETPELAKENALKVLNQGKIPQNPLLKNWQELSVKRALKEAVDNNSEYLAWTTGEQQAARYNLAKQVKSIEWGEGLRKNTKEISISPQDGGYFSVYIDSKGIIYGGGEQMPPTWKGKPIGEAIGKGISEKILAEPKGNLSGEGLNIGGEWAKNLYDKQVKNIVEDITGHKVEVIDMGLPIEGKTKVEWYKTNESGRTGGKLEISELKVGGKIEQPNGEKYIITDILGDGKFKAMPKRNIEKYMEQHGKTQKQIIDLIRTKEQQVQETFDISTKKSAGQQAIRLTPELKAMIRGEAPKLKK